MSGAFVNEEAAARANLPGLPDRSISAARNLVTPRGLALLDEALTVHRAALSVAHAAGDDEAATREERELRYWLARRASAEVSAPPPDASTVVFGATVTLAHADGRTWRLQIVGEDESEPAAGRIAWTTPVARALLGSEVGDTRSLPGGEAEVLAIAAE